MASRHGVARLSLCAICAACSLSAAGASWAAAADDNATWVVVLAGDVPFGSVQTTREQLPDGNQRFVQKTRYLMDLLGQRQEIRESGEYVVTSELAPISCRVENRASSGATVATGKVEQGILRVTIEREGSVLERTISLDDRPLFDVCVPDFLAQQPSSAESVQATVIDSNSWRTSAQTWRRVSTDGEPAKWETSHGKAGKTIWTFAPDGVRRETLLTETNRTIRTATAAEAAAIDYLKFAPRELLMFPVKRHLPFPERAQKITARLTWKEIPFDTLELEDTRQQIIRREQDGESYEVELALTQPAPRDESPRLPVTDAALDAYLGEDDFILPHDPAIQERAQEWSAGAETTLEAVRKLTHEVSEFLQGGEMIAETLSGPEVLKCRKGKCTEFTTLLASLARSVGVPTRVALGMRLVNGQWIGHMWCECWVGQWIPVDATADEVGGSPALLKLTHSDTLMGTQKIRWAMTRSLDVEIVDVEAGRPADLALKTGIVRQTYTDADFACRITAPDEWTLDDRSNPGTPMIQFKPGGNQGDPQIHFVAFGLPSALNPSVLVNARRTRFAAMYQDFEVLTDEPTNIGPLKGRRFAFSRRDPSDAEKTIKTTEIIWTNGRSGFLVNLIAESSLHDALLDQFERLVDSFEALDAAELKK